MKFDLKKVMSRAWEIKKEADRATINSKWNRNDFAPLKKSEKALFGVCLKIAWKEIKDSSITITWKNIEEAADKEVAKYQNGWTASWYCNDWKKGGNDRTYITINEYRNGKMKNSVKCGYWDNKANKYVAFDRYTKCLNLLTGEIA